MNDKFTHEIDKTKLLNALGYNEEGTLHRDRIVMRLLELNLEPLINAIQLASTSSDRLGKRVFWLNIILGIFTIIGTVIAVFQLFKIWIA
jgi:hypothetical protein